MNKRRILVSHWLPDGMLERLRARFSGCEFVSERLDVEIVYGLPPVNQLHEAGSLRWIQLGSAGVPQDLCPVAKERNIRVTNLAGLYGPGIAEHALAMLKVLARHLHQARDNSARTAFDRSIMTGMRDLRGLTLAVIGLGNIGTAVARLARAHGMRVLGCRRREQLTPFVDRVYPLKDLKAMLGEADAVCVAAPQTRHTTGMLGPEEFAALRQGTLYVNISRGGVAQEPALLAALESGRVAAAGLDVFAVEPLPAGHPFWTMPQVLISPHISGETVNLSSRPAERFARNLEAWLADRPLEGLVDLDWGY